MSKNYFSTHDESSIALTLRISGGYMLQKFVPRGLEEQEIAGWFGDAGWSCIGNLSYAHFVKGQLGSIIIAGSPNAEVLRSIFLALCRFALMHHDDFGKDIGYGWLEYPDHFPKKFEGASSEWRALVHLLLSELANIHARNSELLRLILKVRRLIPLGSS